MMWSRERLLVLQRYVSNTKPRDKAMEVEHKVYRLRDKLAI